VRRGAAILAGGFAVALGCGARDGLPQRRAEAIGQEACTPRIFVTSRDEVVAFDTDATTIVWAMLAGGLYVQSLNDPNAAPRLRGTVDRPTSVYLRANDILVTSTTQLLSFERATDAPPQVLATGRNLRDVQAGPAGIVYFDGFSGTPYAELYHLGTNGPPLLLDSKLHGTATGLLYGDEVWVSDFEIDRWDLTTRTRVPFASHGVVVALDDDDAYIALRPMIDPGSLVARSRHDGTERTLIDDVLPWSVALDGRDVYVVVSTQLGEVSLVRWREGKTTTIAKPTFDRAFYSGLRVVPAGLLVSTAIYQYDPVFPLPRLELICK
jgi:hypothetical protein